MARLALAPALALSARALADEGCEADSTCQASETEASALLQSSAARRADAAQPSGAADATTWTTTLPQDADSWDCMCQFILDPVCGLDCKDYANECYANCSAGGRLLDRKGKAGPCQEGCFAECGCAIGRP